MRGSPLLRFLAIGIFLALAGIPIWSLTHREETVVEVPSPPESGNHEVEIVVTSTREAAVTVSYAGKTVLESPVPVTSLRSGVSLPEAGADLIITASWSEATTPNAIRLTAECGGEPVGDTTFWGETSVEDVFTIGGKP